jgi:hypothetical protein
MNSSQVSRAQVDPTHHAADEGVLIGQSEQPFGLFDHLAGLHRDRPAEAARFKERGQVWRQVVPTQGVHGVGHPDVLRRVVTPEMLMGVESGRAKHKGRDLRRYGSRTVKAGGPETGAAHALRGLC